MRMRLRHRRQVVACVAGWLVLGSAAAQTQTQPPPADSNCEPLQAQIDARIRASGVARFSLTTVPADAPVPGKVVGSCDRGRRKIVYLPADAAEAATGSASRTAAPAARPPAAASRAEPILTECKDGTVSLGGDCRKP
jgi:hypothetical protein